ncbi:MAG: nicotinamide-nucleotide amidohydrolase family protein, partial [Rikenellaceae bacterium]
SLIDKQFSLLEQIIGRYIMGYGSDVTVESTVAQMLVDGNATLSVAESCTGGRISSRFTLLSGASQYFKGGAVTYCNEAKENIIGVSADSLREFGAVSEKVAREMAEGVRAKFKSTYSIATTGIAGPTGATIDKPVGTVWIAVSSNTKTIAKLNHFSALRDINIERASSEAISMLRELMLEECIK